MRAGIGYGGSCFPKDVRALDHLAFTEGLNLKLVKSVMQISNRQRLLPLQGPSPAVWHRLLLIDRRVFGLAFKPGADDVREAASLHLIEALVDEGATVRAFDPRANDTARAILPSSVTFAEYPTEACCRANAVALLTERTDIVEADWRTIAASMEPPRFLFDGRNALDPDAMLRLGFEYTGISWHRPASTRANQPARH